MKDFLTACHVHSPIFHRTGVATAGRVNRQTIINYRSRQSVGTGSGSFRFLLRIFTNVGVRRGSQCTFRLFASVERFIFCTFITLDLELAICPGSIYSRCHSFPYYVELFFSHFLIMNDYVNSIDGAKVQIYSGIEQVGGDACSNL